MAKRIREQDFYLDRPKALGWRGLSLLIPACASALGFFAFSVLAFGFAELDTLPDTFRRGLVLVGAFSLAFGGEVGTLSAVVEIFRKNGQAQAWDWLGLAVSILSTLAAFVLAFAALLGVQATWSVSVKLYGPIVLGVLAALDAYSGFMEFGLYLNSHDERMDEWRQAFSQFQRDEWTLARQSRTQQTAKVDKQAVQVDSPVVQAEHEKVSITEGNGQFPVSIEHARAVKVDKALDTKASRLDAMVDIYRQDPDISASDVASRLDISRTTVYKYRDELEQDGLLRRNGHGIEVDTFA